MPEVLGFLKLEKRYLMEGTMVAETGLHIGTGAVAALTDAPFFRDRKGPVVPGSSLRGVLRSTLEKILQAIGGDRGCVLFADDSHPKCFTVNRKRWDAFHREIESKDRAERERAVHRKLLSDDGLCDVCRLFGSPLLASKLKVGDVRPIQPTTAVRDGVGIDRDTETAREHIKYDFEVLYCDQMELQMEIENANGTDLALLAILLKEMSSAGVDLGGKKSRGLGRCRLQGNFKVTGFDSPAGLQRFLASGRLDPIHDFSSKLDVALRNYLGVN